jgi:hypothetical protein
MLIARYTEAIDNASPVVTPEVALRGGGTTDELRSSMRSKSSATERTVSNGRNGFRNSKKLAITHKILHLVV